MKPMEAGSENSPDKQPALLVWSSWVCGTGMGFYILRPHTAAFSKQSTIIRSDKRANTVHSRVKKKHVPLSLSSPFILRPYVALFSLTFSHSPLYRLVISLPLFSFYSVTSGTGELRYNLTHALVTMRAFQLLRRRQIFVSMSSSLSVRKCVTCRGGESTHILHSCRSTDSGIKKDSGESRSTDT